MDGDVIENSRGEMEAVIDIVSGDLAMVKTGRAKPDLLEKVQVEVYESRMPIIELATISAPDPHLLVVQPWDDTILESIAKAISSSNLYISPVVDGNIIRISIPPLSEERREELVKLVNQKLESGRVLLRQARQDTKKMIEDMKGQPGVSEDDIHRKMAELEKTTDEFMKRIEELGEGKREELRTV